MAEIREINAKEIENAVAELCIQANLKLPKSLEKCVENCYNLETDQIAKGIFKVMIENAEIAKKEKLPICQDTGMAVVFLELGQDVHITGGTLKNSVNSGVSKGYTDGFLRASIVSDPLRRKNTENNTPAVIHTEIIPGNTLKIDVCPKGFGSENMSALKMFTPSATPQDIVSYVVEVAAKAGSNPCPPTVIGVGIGGDFEYSAILSKKALCRDISIRNADPFYAEMENSMLENINKLGIGCQGFGGDISALAVNIEIFPTHIAGLPVAVNIGCQVTRHASVIL